MNIKKTVFNRLNHKKQELSKKVDLSLVDDIDGMYDWLEDSYSNALYAPELFNEWIDKVEDFNTELSMGVDNFVVNSSARSFEEAAENMQVKIEELEIKAEELGINPSELIRDYEEIKNILNNSVNAVERMTSAYDELKRVANERFGLADFDI